MSGVEILTSIKCKIADLVTEIPDVGGIAPRCKGYLSHEKGPTDIIIRADLFHPERFPWASENDMVYMETGIQFYSELLKYQGMMLHASAVELDGKAYLFSGPCGTGKSTHTRLWKNTFGDAAQIFNDDKPALRYVDNRWFSYGTPWCGKDGINQNKKVPLAGICFLKQADVNNIRQLSNQEAMNQVIYQTFRKFKTSEKLDLMLSQVDKLVREIPCFEMENRPEPDAVKLSYETMCNRAKEMGL